MMVVVLSIFVMGTKMIFRYDFVASLIKRFSKTREKFGFSRTNETYDADHRPTHTHTDAVSP